MDLRRDDDLAALEARIDDPLTVQALRVLLADLRETRRQRDVLADAARAALLDVDHVCGSQKLHLTPMGLTDALRAQRVLRDALREAEPRG